MKHGSLFTGIGGFDLAAQWVGWENIFQCEIDNYCQKQLEKRFPNVDRYTDIRQFDARKYRDSIDIISGGFPCQNISLAASKNRVGVDGEKSGLWREQLRIVEEVRPKFVLIENSATINKKGFGQLLGAYSDIGYHAEWYRLEPRQFGLPQKRRQRTYALFYTSCIGDRLQEKQIFTGWDKPEYPTWRCAENRIYGVADGVSHRVDRHRTIGNSIVPQIAFEIFKAINTINNERD